MGWLQRVENRMKRRQPQVDVVTPDHQRLFPMSTQVLADLIAGGDMSSTLGGYITINSVYACVTGRADLLKSLPLKAYRFSKSRARSFQTRQQRRVATRYLVDILRSSKPGDHARVINAAELEEVNEGPLVELLSAVNPFWTRQRLLSLTEMGLGLWGKSIWFLERRTPASPPTEIWTAPGNQVRTIADPKNIISHFEYTPTGAVKPIPYDRNEVIWFNYPDPRNPITGSLSPIQAAVTNADYERDSMKANQNLHKQGFQVGGFVFPMGEKTWEEGDAGIIEDAINKRAMGVDKAHRWAVFRQHVDMKEFGVSPKDAEFLGGLNWSLEAVCRVYKWPVDLVGGGKRTYENYPTALRAAWTHAVLPEAGFIASELTEQLLPMYPARTADLLWFDASGIADLQEAETEKWNRAKEQIEKGVITINTWLKSQGMDPVPWGDVWWAPANLLPVSSGNISVGEMAERIKLLQPQQPALLLPGPQVDTPSAEDYARLMRQVVIDLNGNGRNG